MLTAQQFYIQVIEIQHKNVMNDKFKCMQLYAEYVINICDQRSKRTKQGEI